MERLKTGRNVVSIVYTTSIKRVNDKYARMRLYKKSEERQSSVATRLELRSQAYRQEVHGVPEERSNSCRRAFDPKIEPYIDSVPRNFSSNSLC